MLEAGLLGACPPLLRWSLGTKSKPLRGIFSERTSEDVF